MISKKNIWIFVLLITACSIKEQPQLSNEIKCRCAEYYATGEFGYGYYSFCSTVPVPVNYSYKSGPWKFWNLSGQLIAAGEFDNPEFEVDDHGGCSYKVIQNKIISTQWKFWDKNGNPINPNKNLIKTLESCQTIQ